MLTLQRKPHPCYDCATGRHTRDGAFCLANCEKYDEYLESILPARNAGQPEGGGGSCPASGTS